MHANTMRTWLIAALTGKTVCLACSQMRICNEIYYSNCDHLHHWRCVAISCSPILMYYFLRASSNLRMKDLNLKHGTFDCSTFYHLASACDSLIIVVAFRSCPVSLLQLSWFLLKCCSIWCEVIGVLGSCGSSSPESIALRASPGRLKCFFASNSPQFPQGISMMFWWISITHSKINLDPTRLNCNTFSICRDPQITEAPPFTEICTGSWTQISCPQLPKCGVQLWNVSLSCWTNLRAFQCPAVKSKFSIS